jgi:hypothetical protein
METVMSNGAVVVPSTVSAYTNILMNLYLLQVVGWVSFLAYRSYSTPKPIRDGRADEGMRGEQYSPLPELDYHPISYQLMGDRTLTKLSTTAFNSTKS